jgi:hypothetical protein
MVKAGCEEILRHLAAQRLSKVLNDNSNMTGIWVGAAYWVASNWFPRVEARAGSHQSPGPAVKAGKVTFPMTRFRWPSASQSFRIKGPTVCTSSA